MRASASARARVRLTMAMRSNPREISAWTIARAAPPAPMTTADPGRSAQPGALVVHVRQKAGDVGVVAHQPPVLAPQRVDRAKRLRDRRSPVAGGEGRFLVGHGDIGADEPLLADFGRELGEIRPAARRKLVGSG